MLIIMPFPNARLIFIWSLEQTFPKHPMKMAAVPNFCYDKNMYTKSRMSLWNFEKVRVLFPVWSLKKNLRSELAKSTSEMDQHLNDSENITVGSIMYWWRMPRVVVRDRCFVCLSTPEINFPFKKFFFRHLFILLRETSLRMFFVQLSEFPQCASFIFFHKSFTGIQNVVS